MASFRFRLATLLKLRASLRDQCRTQLAEATEAEEALDHHLEECLQDERDFVQKRRQAASPASFDLDQLIDAQRYTVVMKAEQQLLGQQKEMLAEEIERRRQALAEANRDVRILETLREKQLERHRDNETRRENKQLDEITAQLYVKNQNIKSLNHESHVEID